MDVRAEEKQKKQGSLARQIILVAILPLLGLVLASAIYGIAAFREGLNQAAAEELSDIAALFWADYDALYPGDLSMKDEDGLLVFYKGDTRIDEDTSLLDHFKELTNTELTIFYQDTRILTTLADENGNRPLGTGASGKILDDVLKNGKTSFYPNTHIFDETYLTWYRPITNSSGAIVGMLGVATRQKNVDSYFGYTAIPLVCIALISLVFTAWLALSYSRRLTKTLSMLKDFVQQVSAENLSSTLSPQVVRRKDELGSMARSVVEMQQSLKRLIETDQLTGLYNRRFAEKKYHTTWLEAENKGIPFCLCMADIDFFKKVNDTYGHGAGDQVLMDVSSVLKQAMRGNGYACRFGGEEFLLVFEDVSMDQALKCLQETLDTIRAHVVEYGDEKIKVTMSFGLTEGYSFLSEHALLKEADDRLYRAKENGRNQIVSQGEDESPAMQPVQPGDGS